MGDVGRAAGRLGFGVGGAWLGMAIGGPGSMLIGLGYMGGSFLGQMVFPNKMDIRMPQTGGYPIQSAQKGSPIPIVYGQTRVAGNLIWMGPTTTYEVEADGGKGGSEPTMTYFRKSFAFALCEGERWVKRVWEGKNEVSIGITYSRAGEDTGGGKGDILEGFYAPYRQEITIFPGDGVNYGLSDLIGEDYCDYKYTCVVFFENWDLGAVDALPNFTFEVVEAKPLGCVWGSNGYIGRMSVDYEIEQAAISQSGFSVDYDPLTGRYACTMRPTAAGQGRPIAIYDQDGVDQNITFENSGDPDWSDTDVIQAVRFSADGTSIYAMEFRLGALANRVHKWNSTTGASEWVIVLSGVDAYSMEIDSQDNLYIGGYGAFPYDIGIYDVDGAFVTAWENISTGWDFYMDEANFGQDFIDEYGVQGWLLMVGRDVRWALGVDKDRVTLRHLSNGTQYTSDLGYTDGTIATSCIRIGGKSYVTTNDNKLWKLDEELNVLTSVDVPVHAILHVYAGPGGTVCINCAEGATHIPIVYMYSRDLELLSTYSPRNDDFPGVDWVDTAWSEAVYSYDTRGGGDANPADIILDLCSNTRYGARMPWSRINLASFETIRAYCAENDLLISPIIDTQKPLLDWIQYICSHFGGFIYFVGTELYLGAWRGEDPEIHLTASDLVTDGDTPPLQIRKRPSSQLSNDIEVLWKSRADIYGPAVTPARDDVDIRVSGKRKKKSIELAGICRPVLSQKLAYRFLIDSMYRFGTYNFQLGFKHSLVYPSMVCLLSDGYKVTNQRVRITSVAESKDGSALSIEAVEDVSDLYPDIDWTPEVTDRVPDDRITGADLVAPIVTTREDWHDRLLRFSFAPQGEYCSGWHLFISRDNVTYTFIHTVSISSLTGGDANSAGTTLTSLPGGTAPTWRGDESVTVSIGTITDLHSDVTDQEFFDGRRLAKIGNEIVAYKDCEETDIEGEWVITGLIRGLFQTTPTVHAVGDTFRTLDIDHPWIFQPEDVGKTIYVKALTYYRDATMGLSDVTPTEIVIAGNYLRPYGASLVRLTSDENDGGFEDYEAGAFDAYWNLADKDTGWNVGSQDGGGTWEYGDDEAELIPQSGVPYANYLQDADLQGIDVTFHQNDDTLISTQTLGIVSTTSVNKTTDLSGNNPAKVKVWPRYAMRATREESLLADDGS